MFKDVDLKLWVQNIPVDTSKLNSEQAVALMVRVAKRERDRVLGTSISRSGHTPAYRQVVDGIDGAALESVRPDGMIVFAWQYLAEVVDDTLGALINRSPHDSGDYIRGIIVSVDGVTVPIQHGTRGSAAINSATQKIEIIASVPYARRLEVGRMRGSRGRPPSRIYFVKQVGPHIVEETAIVARKLHSALADITFNYTDLTDPYILQNAAGFRTVRGRTVKHLRYPAIIIRPKTA